MIQPDYIFESSWEVCNKVGGIYTVLSTKARTLQQKFTDRIIFIGPLSDKPSAEFEPDATLFADWQQRVTAETGLRIRVGRWNVPGRPVAMLVDFKPLYRHRNELFYEMWESFGVDSSRSYGDYDESCLFAIAVAKVIDHFYAYHNLHDRRVVAHFNEWTLGMGLLYLRKYRPSVATLFTTHATSMGRSIAGNGKPLYGYMDGYDGDQMAQELNMVSKHAVEKQAAHRADCFTTVSEITAVECRRLLERVPDVITPNGFEPGFVPVGEAYAVTRSRARKSLLDIVSRLTGRAADPDALLVATSGRYEYRNKGLDLFIDAIDRLRVPAADRPIYAFILTPAWVYAPRADLRAALDNRFADAGGAMNEPFVTHWLHEMNNDRVMNRIHECGFTNGAAERVAIIFVPCYLDGADGIVDLPYYDLLTGFDATVFPSYYEPWGYTPLESIAFGIPTITTSLAGFGRWALTETKGCPTDGGVTVIDRTDDNYTEVANHLAETIGRLAVATADEAAATAERCRRLAEQAEWHRFVAHYETAFSIALEHAAERCAAGR